MLLSCALAYVMPFELFLFSYAVLGPLHYLTEITWLKQRDCFTTGKKDYIFLIVPCVILTFIVLVGTYHDKPVVDGLYEFCTSLFGLKFFGSAYIMIFVAFFSALAFVLFKDGLYKLIFILVTLFLGIILKDVRPIFIFFAIFLPTLIHVFVFTGLFIILGALKNRSITGIVSALVFVLCAVIFFIWKPIFHFYAATDYAQQAVYMGGNGFATVNMAIISFLQNGRISMETLFQSQVGLSVGRFIAFAYTYHYLNWFSKTEVIKWHKVPAKWLAAVVGLWIFSVVLYVYDYKTGLMALYFLSMLHVFLEFPLNYRSVIGIVEESRIFAGFQKPKVVKTKAVAATARKK